MRRHIFKRDIDIFIKIYHSAHCRLSLLCIRLSFSLFSMIAIRFQQWLYTLWSSSSSLLFSISCLLKIQFSKWNKTNIEPFLFVVEVELEMHSVTVCYLDLKFVSFKFIWLCWKEQRIMNKQKRLTMPKTNWKFCKKNEDIENVSRRDFRG